MCTGFSLTASLLTICGGGAPDMVMPGTETPRDRAGRSLQGHRLRPAVSAGFLIIRGRNRADVEGLGSFLF